MKGLYKKARAGQLKNFTGIDSPYEPPRTPGDPHRHDAQCLAGAGRGPHRRRADPVNDADTRRANRRRPPAELLLDLQSCGVQGKKLGKAGDQTANEFLVQPSGEQRPKDGVLSEEMKYDGTRLEARRGLDHRPVDGTREYGEGRTDWAVHVGLAINGVAEIGAVALPG